MPNWCYNSLHVSGPSKSKYKTDHNHDDDYAKSHPEVRISFECPICGEYTDIDVIRLDGKYTEPIVAQRCLHLKYFLDDVSEAMFGETIEEEKRKRGYHGM